MRYRILLLIGFIGFCWSLKAQSLVFSGKVVDSLHQELPFANVLAINPESQSVAAFAVTSETGEFKLTLNAQSTYLIKASFVGYVPFEQVVTMGDTKLENVLIELKTSTDYLEAVEVVDQMPVTMSGDTLVYTADAFTTGRERKLGDVLNQLPGVEVDENGEIKVQGKRVDNVLVEGKKFFGGDSKMATKNLPANAIDKVQVLRDFNEVGPMDGLRNEESLAINIKLKSDKKRMVFGDATLSGGPEQRYLGHANMFYYAPKLNVNAIADMNNIGELAFTMLDYYRFTGGNRKVTANSGTDMNTTVGLPDFPDATRESAQQLNTKLGALNFTYVPSKKWDHTGFFIGSSADNAFGSFSQRTYLTDSTYNEEGLSSVTNAENRSALMKYAVTYKPGHDTYWQYNALAKLSNQQTFENRISSFATNENDITERSGQTPWNLEQQLLWYHVLDEKNILSWESSFGISDQDPQLNLMSDRQLFPLLLDQAASWRQIRNLRSRDVKSVFNYYRILNKTNHVNLSAGMDYMNQDYETKLFARQETSDSLVMQNKVDFSFRDVFVGITYKTKIDQFVFSPGVFAHQYQTLLNLDETGQKETVFLSPSFYAKWNLRNTESITMRYAWKTSFWDVNNLAGEAVLSDYNSLFRGNPQMQQGRYHSFNLFYNFFNLFDGLNLFSIADYQLKTNDLINRVDFMGTERVNRTMNSNTPTQTAMGMLQLDKRFIGYRMKTSAQVNWRSFENVINDQSGINESLTQQYKVSFGTTFWNDLDLDIGYNHQISNYGSDQQRNVFTRYEPEAKLKWNLSKSLEFRTNYSINFYNNEQQQTTSQYAIWDAALSYKDSSSPWEFSLSAYNLLDTRGVRNDSFTESLISSYEYHIQKRYVVIGVQYEF